MKYNLFLVDLDDTLLDFQASEKLAFKMTLDHFNIGERFDEIHRVYKVINDDLWKQLERGEVDKDFLKVERFRKTLKHFNLEVNSKQMAEDYINELPNNVVLIDDAIEACRHLKNFGEIGILTNGIANIQNKRIEVSGLAPFIDFVAVSESSGFAKPDVRFYEYAIKYAKNFSKDKTLMIGDRLEADILGAKNFQIDSCWFNPRKTESDEKLKPTYEITSLKDIFKLN